MKHSPTCLREPRTSSLGVSLAAILTTALAASPSLAGGFPSGETHRPLRGGRVAAFLEGKQGPGSEASCEDGIYADPHYLLVVDGATDKSGIRYPGEHKGGRIARDLVLQTFARLPPELDGPGVVRRLNQALRAFHSEHPEVDFRGAPSTRPTASLIWYSFRRRELVALGDCKARVDGRTWNDQEKLVDRVNAATRALVLEELGLTPGQILERDLGREYILPLLRAQGGFQNNPEAPEAFQYWVLDGFEVPEHQLRSWSFDEPPRRIELSSDGYPGLPLVPTVSAYERLLRERIAADPACVGINRSTKGIRTGQVSFDDRSVLIWEAPPRK